MENKKNEKLIIKNSDKIYEAYKGELGLSLQEKTKNRFSWMAKYINGNKLLDVGCSSGIFSILMAREGKTVLGLDLDSESIEKANIFKEQESKDVQKNLSFIVSSLDNFDTREKFSTIILGEILEHLYYPEDILKKVSNWLDKNGTLIVTVPFGLNNYFDHKKYYYLVDIILETKEYYELVKIDYLGDWIGAIFKHKTQKEDTERISIDIVKELETAFLTRESNLRTENSNLRTENSNLRTENSNLRTEFSEIIVNNEKKLMLTENQHNILKNKILELEKKNRKLEDIMARFNNKKIIIILKKLRNIFRRIKNGLLNNLGVSFFRKYKNKYNKESQINMNFYENIDKLISNIPDSNGSNYYNKSTIKIAIITDEYIYNYYKDAVKLIYLDYKNYKNIVDSVDFVMFVSCWKGMKQNDWRGVSGKEGQEKVKEVFCYAKSKNKKILFQTIEDPSNYEIYLPLAKEADYIFTTASEMIDNYKKDTGNNNVFCLDYGVNPQFHNPVGFKNTAKLKNAVFFAGSWAPRYKERCEDSEILFDGIIKSSQNFILADRNYYIKGYEFPTKYYKYIIPSIDHHKLQKVHKLFDWSINLNSIKYSPTMCAMRVYELQAIGNLMISNYSMAVNNKFPNIFIVYSPDEVSKILNAYNEIDIYKMQVEGIRNVMSTHTVFDKLNYIFECINEKKYIIEPKKVLLVCDKLTKKIKKVYNEQTYLSKDIVDIKQLDKINSESYDYLAYISEKVTYKRTYLEDMINAFKYTNADFIAIESDIIDNVVSGVNHDYISFSNNIDKMVFDSKIHNYKKIFSELKIEGNGYSIDPFSIIDLPCLHASNAQLSVIVPIYNNGKYLLNKCFNSLLRSSFFKNMEIILIDDGSTDRETIEIIKDINHKYDNVKAFFFEDGGSGSASRPRNKGIELATTNYITFLDPDNEAINDGYAKLYDILKNEEYDFVFGSIVKFSDKKNILSYESKNQIINNPKKELIEKNFKTNSIQACVIKKELIVKNFILNPIGAAGQDSLFFQELMINSKKVYYLNLPIHIYYASRSDSIVNSINAKFFEKFLIMEKYQVKKLKDYGLFEEYKKRRFEKFLNDWYYEKLKFVTGDKEKEISIKILDKIKKLYD